MRLCRIAAFLAWWLPALGYAQVTQLCRPGVNCTVTTLTVTSGSGTGVSIPQGIYIAGDGSQAQTTPTHGFRWDGTQWNFGSDPITTTGAISIGAVTGTSFTATIASGSNAFVMNSGALVSFGTGTLGYSSGSNYVLFTPGGANGLEIASGGQLLLDRTSGSNAIAFGTAGARLNLNSGSDWLADDGSGNATFNAAVKMSSTLQVSSTTNFQSSLTFLGHPFVSWPSNASVRLIGSNNAASGPAIAFGAENALTSGNAYVWYKDNITTQIAALDFAGNFTAVGNFATSSTSGNAFACTGASPCHLQSASAQDLDLLTGSSAGVVRLGDAAFDASGITDIYGPANVGIANTTYFTMVGGASTITLDTNGTASSTFVVQNSATTGVLQLGTATTTKPVKIAGGAGAFVNACSTSSATTCTATVPTGAKCVATSQNGTQTLKSVAVASTTVTVTATASGSDVWTIICL